DGPAPVCPLAAAGVSGAGKRGLGGQPDHRDGAAHHPGAAAALRRARRSAGVRGPRPIPGGRAHRSADRRPQQADRMSWSLYALMAVPLVATLLCLVDGWHLARGATVVAGIISLILAVAISLSVTHGQVIVAAGGWMRVDSLGAVFLLATGLLYAIAGVFSIGYLAVAEGHADASGFAKRYFAYMNRFGWTMLLVPLAADFGTLWVAVELTTIVSALLVAIDRTDAALEASWKY